MKGEIIIFGGTTEGRRAAEVLEEAGSPFFYSTKTGEQDLVLQHGIRIDGVMDGDAMQQFCQQHDVALIVDAAHPFATKLHETIACVAASLQLSVIRYERIYPPRAPDIIWIDDYAQIPTDIRSLLATTGVQSIARLKFLESKGVRVLYRILPRQSSVSLAHQQGATDDQLCFFEDSSVIDVEADAILLKESGETGGFSEKVAAARAKGMRVIAIKRPEWNIERLNIERLKNERLKIERVKSEKLKSECSIVNGPHGLRRAVQHLLPAFFPLHSGLTTGTCATAATVAATTRLLTGATPAEVPVILPNGETIHVSVSYGDGYAACIKEAGDDPDVTNGIEIRASVEPAEQFVILGGEGVGRFTLPGFDYPPGEAAINKAPREMIQRNLMGMGVGPSPTFRPQQRRSASVVRGDWHSVNPLIPHYPVGERVEGTGMRVTLSVPGGADVAKRTFNPRLGIEGGISIIGVSGIVKPFSEEAFIDSIRKCMEVAAASGTAHVVINSGAKSERTLRERFPALPQQAFVQYGNYIGETLQMAADLGFREVTLGVMLGKAVKLAQGHLDTHSRKATMDLDFVRQLLHEAECDVDISDITLARELWQRIPACRRVPFVRVVIDHCAAHCNPLFPCGSLTILLIDDDGKIYGGS